MRAYLRYTVAGLVLMAPQELIVALFAGRGVSLYLMAMAFWAVMLSAMYGLFKLTSRSGVLQSVEATLSMAFYALVGLGIEWGLIGNSPWANPGANQLGLVSGWVSVFTLPRVFVEDGFAAIKWCATLWYVAFVLSLFLPVVGLNEKGAAVGITIYGYSVVPFFLLSLWYVHRKVSRSGRS